MGPLLILFTVVFTSMVVSVSITRIILTYELAYISRTNLGKN